MSQEVSVSMDGVKIKTEPPDDYGGKDYSTSSAEVRDESLGCILHCGVKIKEEAFHDEPSEDMSRLKRIKYENCLPSDDSVSSTTNNNQSTSIPTGRDNIALNPPRPLLQFPSFLVKDNVDSDKSVDCQYCGFRTHHRGQMVLHKMTMHGTVKVFTCHFCQYTTSRKSVLDRHITSIHKNGKPFPCNFLQCGFAAMSKADLKTHVVAVHIGVSMVRPFICMLCPYMGRHMWDTVKHVRVEHAETLLPSAHYIDNIFPCFHCDHPAFDRESDLMYHVEISHEEDDYLPCLECHFVAKGMKALYSHFEAEHNIIKSYLKYVGKISKDDKT